MCRGHTVLFSFLNQTVRGFLRCIARFLITQPIHFYCETKLESRHAPNQRRVYFEAAITIQKDAYVEFQTTASVQKTTQETGMLVEMVAFREQLFVEMV